MWMPHLERAHNELALHKLETCAYVSPACRTWRLAAVSALALVKRVDFVVCCDVISFV